MAVKFPSYLHQNRHGIFGFRVVIPLALRLYFRQNDFRITLRTGERQKARQIALGLASLTQGLFQKIRTMDDQGRDWGASFVEDLEAERDRLTGLFLPAMQAYADLGDQEEAIENELSLLRNVRETLDVLSSSPSPEDQALAQQTYPLFQQRCAAILPLIMAFSDAEESASENVKGLRGRFQNLSLSTLHKEKLAAQASSFAAEKEKLSDFAASIISKSAALAGNIADTPVCAGDMLSAVVEAYCDTQKAEGNWTAKTEAEIRAIYAMWLRIVGDQPIKGYGYEQHREYRSVLLRLPPNVNKSPRYRGKSIPDILALGDAPAAPNTINKSLTRLAALFAWAVEYGYTTLNPAGGMTMKNPKRASDERCAFDDEDLKRLFQSQEFLDWNSGQPFMRWTLLIALYTGARQNEIAQLHLSDFKEADGIPVISINDDGDGKRLKTKAGKRLIPIHPELQRLGLWDYVAKLREQGESRLFPELPASRDGYGKKVSKWFAGYRKRVGITDSGKVFHSFRHTVIDRLKQAGVPKEKIAALVGHEDDSVTFGRYGKDFAPRVMLDVVSVLRFLSIGGA